MSDIPRPPRKGQDPPAARHLRLVSDKPTPPREKRPKNQRIAPTFSDEERTRLRAALRGCRAVFGTYACAADAMRIPVNTLHEALARNGVSPDLAVRLARALGKPLESLYRAPTNAGRCAACGRST